MAKHWIKSVSKGLDHGALHRALGVPEGKTIPHSKLEQAAKHAGKIGQEARLALTMEKFHHDGSKK